VLPEFQSVFVFWEVVLRAISKEKNKKEKKWFRVDEGTRNFVFFSSFIFCFFVCKPLEDSLFWRAFSHLEFLFADAAHQACPFFALLSAKQNQRERRKGKRNK